MSELLKNAEQAARLEDYAIAEKYCREHLLLMPSDKEGMRLLAFVCALERRYSEAIETITEVIRLSSDKPEPSDYLDRGRWNLESGDFTGACSDFSEVASLCARYEDNYYLEVAHMHRAIALAAQGATSAAERDLGSVDDECEVFVRGERVSKAALLERLHSLGNP